MSDLDDYCTLCGRSNEDLQDIQLQGHGMGQKAALDSISEYLNLVAQEMQINAGLPEMAAIVMGLAVSLKNGDWHNQVAELREIYTEIPIEVKPKQQPS